MSSLLKKMEKYPRLGSVRKIGPGAKCHYCGQPAGFKAWIEVSFFRGEDEEERMCNECLDKAKKDHKYLNTRPQP